MTTSVLGAILQYYLRYIPETLANMLHIMQTIIIIVAFG